MQHRYKNTFINFPIILTLLKPAGIRLLYPFVHAKPNGYYNCFFQNCKTIISSSLAHFSFF